MSVPDEGAPRLDTALAQLRVAVIQGSECLLSNVFYNAANDGVNYPDGEGGWNSDDWGYDCDDLAAVLLPILQEHFESRGAS